VYGALSYFLAERDSGMSAVNDVKPSRFRYQCMRPSATSVYGLKLLVYGALRYFLAERDGGLSGANALYSAMPTHT
jgi:hypothetical protein